MSTTITVKVDSELEAIASEKHATVESLVNEAITLYRQTYEGHMMRERLEQEYQALSQMWGELANDLGTEQWLNVENEALTNLEKSLDN
jgi:hypothetical protein